MHAVPELIAPTSDPSRNFDSSGAITSTHSYSLANSVYINQSINRDQSINLSNSLINTIHKELKMKIPFWLYWICSSIIATCICGGLNTFTTWILYTDKEDITAMFAWPSTVAGDVVITIVSTAIITWLLSCQLTMLDMSKTKPFDVQNKPTLDKPATGNCCTTTLFSTSMIRKAHLRLIPVAAATNNNNTEEGNGGDNFCQALWQNIKENLLSIILTGAIIGLILTPPIGIPFVVIGYFMTDDIWTMETLLIYKGILGGLLGLLLQPWIVILAATELPPEESDLEEGDEGEKITASNSAFSDEGEETKAQQQQQQQPASVSVITSSQQLSTEGGGGGSEP